MRTLQGEKGRSCLMGCPLAAALGVWRGQRAWGRNEEAHRGQVGSKGTTETGSRKKNNVLRETEFEEWRENVRLQP